MHAIIRRGLIAALGGLLWLPQPAALAAEPEISLSMLPLRQIIIDGDKEKFQAHHWMKNGYAGGIKDFSMQYTAKDGTEFGGEGHAIIDQNDIGADFSLKNAKLGFVNLGYSSFRKFFDNAGGVHRRFATLQSNTTDRDLHLDIGKLELETGLTLEGWPELVFLYEHELKQGVKSRLTWASVQEASEVRKIAPSWQEIDEVVDVFALEAQHTLAGFEVNGEQRWEFVRSENFREERQLTTNTDGLTAGTSKIRRQEQDPQAILTTTTLGANRHFWNDKAFFSSGYHFNRLNNREFETLAEFNANGVAANYSNPEQKPNNRADNDYDAHTWVGTVAYAPWQAFSLSTKLKAEIIKRRSNSSYNRDDDSGSPGTPDGILNATELSISDSKAARWGEGLALRYTGLPRTALYTELEFEQTRLLLREDRQSIDGPDSGNGVSTNEIFSRETVTKVRRGVWTLGGRVSPSSVLDLTANVRHRIHNADYDDQRETTPGSSTARSAFFDGQSIHTNQFESRATYRPCRWFRSSLRYQYRDDDYATRVEGEPIVKTGMLSNIYTYDVTLQPVQDLVTTLSFSRQTAATKTPARYHATIPIPAFNANVNTWLFGLDYTFLPAVTVGQTLQYSRAKNFNDFANVSLPYGVDNERLDLTTSLRWVPTEDVSLEAEYGFYHFRANGNAEVGNYDAHLISLEVSKKF